MVNFPTFKNNMAGNTRRCITDPDEIQRYLDIVGSDFESSSDEIDSSG